MQNLIRWLGLLLMTVICSATTSTTFFLNSFKHLYGISSYLSSDDIRNIAPFEYNFVETMTYPQRLEEYKKTGNIELFRKIIAYSFHKNSAVDILHLFKKTSLQEIEMLLYGDGKSSIYCTRCFQKFVGTTILSDLLLRDGSFNYSLRCEAGTAFGGMTIFETLRKEVIYQSRLQTFIESSVRKNVDFTIATKHVNELLKHPLSLRPLQTPPEWVIKYTTNLANLYHIDGAIYLRSPYFYSFFYFNHTDFNEWMKQGFNCYDLIHHNLSNALEHGIKTGNINIIKQIIDHEQCQDIWLLKNSDNLDALSIVIKYFSPRQGFVDELPPQHDLISSLLITVTSLLMDKGMKLNENSNNLPTPFSIGHTIHLLPLLGLMYMRMNEEEYMAPKLMDNFLNIAKRSRLGVYLIGSELYKIDNIENRLEELRQKNPVFQQDDQFYQLYTNFVGAEKETRLGILVHFICRAFKCEFCGNGPSDLTAKLSYEQILKAITHAYDNRLITEFMYLILFAKHSGVASKFVIPRLDKNKPFRKTFWATLYIYGFYDDFINEYDTISFPKLSEEIIKPHFHHIDEAFITRVDTITTAEGYYSFYLENRALDESYDNQILMAYCMPFLYYIDGSPTSHYLIHDYIDSDTTELFDDWSDVTEVFKKTVDPKTEDVYSYALNALTIRGFHFDDRNMYGNALNVIIIDEFNDAPRRAIQLINRMVGEGDHIKCKNAVGDNILFSILDILEVENFFQLLNILKPHVNMFAKNYNGYNLLHIAEKMNPELSTKMVKKYKAEMLLQDPNYFGNLPFSLLSANDEGNDLTDVEHFAVKFTAMGTIIRQLPENKNDYRNPILMIVKTVISLRHLFQVMYDDADSHEVTTNLYTLGSLYNAIIQSKIIYRNEIAKLVEVATTLCKLVVAKLSNGYDIKNIYNSKNKNNLKTLINTMVVMMKNDYDLNRIAITDHIYGIPIVEQSSLDAATKNTNFGINDKDTIEFLSSFSEINLYNTLIDLDTSSLVIYFFNQIYSIKSVQNISIDNIQYTQPINTKQSYNGYSLQKNILIKSTASQLLIAYTLLKDNELNFLRDYGIVFSVKNSRPEEIPQYVKPTKRVREPRVVLKKRVVTETEEQKKQREWNETMAKMQLTLTEDTTKVTNIFGEYDRKHFIRYMNLLKKFIEEKKSIFNEPQFIIIDQAHITIRDTLMADYTFWASKISQVKSEKQFKTLKADRSSTFTLIENAKKAAQAVLVSIYPKDKYRFNEGEMAYYSKATNINVLFIADEFVLDKVNDNTTTVTHPPVIESVENKQPVIESNVSEPIVIESSAINNAVAKKDEVPLTNKQRKKEKKMKGQLESNENNGIVDAAVPDATPEGFLKLLRDTEKNANKDKYKKSTKKEQPQIESNKITPPKSQMKTGKSWLNNQKNSYIVNNEDDEKKLREKEKKEHEERCHLFVLNMIALGAKGAEPDYTKFEGKKTNNNKSVMKKEEEKKDGALTHDEIVAMYTLTDEQYAEYKLTYGDTFTREDYAHNLHLFNQYAQQIAQQKLEQQQDDREEEKKQDNDNNNNNKSKSKKFKKKNVNDDVKEKKQYVSLINLAIPLSEPYYVIMPIKQYPYGHFLLNLHSDAAQQEFNNNEDDDKNEGVGIDNLKATYEYVPETCIPDYVERNPQNVFEARFDNDTAKIILNNKIRGIKVNKSDMIKIE